MFNDIIEWLLLPAFSHIQLSDMCTGQLQAYIAGRAKIVKPNTIRNEVTVIKLLFKYASKWNYIRHNPSDNLERPKIDKPEIEILSPEDFEQFLKEVERPYRAAFLTAFLTGMRAWGIVEPSMW